MTKQINNLLTPNINLRNVKTRAQKLVEAPGKFIEPTL